MAAERWRITLGELESLTHATATDLDRWADLGALGPAYRERPKSGRWRHITREASQRAVVMARLMAAGLSEGEAAHIAAGHDRYDDSPMKVELSDHVVIIVDRGCLP